MPKEVNVHEAKTHLSKLLNRVIAGEEIVIAKNGHPVAKLVPFQKPKRKRELGRDRGKIWIAPDFDEFDEEIERLFYGE